MEEIYSSEILRIVIAQIAQTIGYSNAQNAPLELLEDILLRFIQELARDLHSQAEHANRIEPNIKDVQLSFNNLSIDIREMLDYIGNVEPVPFVREVPKYPVKRNIHLNFLKPGSEETLTRPVHIFEYLPAMLPSTERILGSSTCPPSEIDNISSNYQQKCADISISLGGEQNVTGMHNWSKQMESSMAAFKSPSTRIDAIDGHVVRIINSVVMTTGGFISPAIEGKLPEALIPHIIEKFKGLDAPPISKSPDTVESTNTIALEPNLLNARNQVSNDEGVRLTGDKFMLHEISSGHNKAEKKNMGIREEANMPALTLPIQSKPPKMKKKHVTSAEVNVSRAQEKAHRKALKIYQKLSKSQVEGDSSVVGLKKSLKNLNRGGIHSPITSDSRTTTMERTHLEKLLKRQTKRQKQLKSQKHHQQQSHVQNVCKRLSGIDEFSSASRNQPVTSISARSMPLPSDDTLALTNSTFGTSTLGSLSPNKISQKFDQVKQIDTTNSLLADEVKLGNEPERNKLNIFKKLTKPNKILKSDSPNALYTMPTNLFGNVSTGSPLINLPSGTTITPAPALSASENYVSTSNLIMPAYKEQLIATQPGLSENLNEQSIPKKRGRKPGGKNNSTRSQIQNELTTSKKIKCYKLSGATTISYPSINLPSNTALLSGETAPQNLSHIVQTKQAEQLPNILPDNLLKQVGEDVQSQPICFDPVGNGPPKNIKLKKNKDKQEKRKRKLKHNQFERDDNLIRNDLEEEINQKEPEPSHAKDSLELNQISSSLSPTNINAIKNFSTDLSSPVSGVHGYMASISTLPILSFPPRPGLIPTGLFSPTSLVNFTKNNKIMSHSFMSLPDTTIRSSSASGYASLLETATEKKSTEIDMLPLSDSHSERRYCNVAPLVPDSMKLTALPIDGQKLNPIIDPIVDEYNEIQGKSLMNLSKSPLINQSVNIRAKCLHEKILENKVDKPKTTTIGTGNLGDPIEVSDDSNDNNESNIRRKGGRHSNDVFLQKSNIITSNIHKFDKSHPYSFMENSITTVADDFNQFKKLPTIKVNDPECINPLSVVPSRSPSAFNINFMGNDKFSLAGGADLIPLSCVESGLAYSSRTVPATSLSAGATSESSPQNNDQPSEHNFVSKMVVGYDDVTITPTSNPNICMNDLKLHKLHKKLKRTKEGKIKKKKDKKDKTKSKDKCDEKSLSKVDKLKSVDKKQKKDKKKEKLQVLQTDGLVQLPKDNLDRSTVLHIKDNALNARNELGPVQVVASGTILHASPQDVATLTHLPSPNSDLSPNQVPKLTLKLGGKSTPIPNSPNHYHCDEHDSPIQTVQSKQIALNPISTKTTKREHSPELARFSPLVTGPPKLKQCEAQTVVSSATTTPVTVSSEITTTNANLIPNASVHNNWLISGEGTGPSSNFSATLSASSVLLPQQLIQVIPKRSSIPPLRPKAVPSDTDKVPESVSLQSEESHRPSSYVDAEGYRIWICPACGKVDDGSAMIGCDGCDAWYHWTCVGIFVAPNDNEDWFCRICITKKKVYGSEKKKRRNKKK